MKPFLDTFRFRHAALAVLCAFGLLLAGCGGSSSGGDGGEGGSGGGGGFEPANYNEEQAVVGSDEDAKTVSKAARESAQQAILEEEQPDQGFPTGISISANGEESLVYDISMSLLDVAAMPSAAETVPIEGDCGGRALVTVSDNYSDQYIEYQDYCTIAGDDQYIIDGYFDFENRDDSSSYRYTFDYVITYRGETYRSRGTYSCNEGDCSYQNYFVGTDGRQYRTENVSVFGSNGSYSVSARVYDQDLGYVDYEASNLTLCDSGVGFSFGTITVRASGGTLIEVTFSSCDSYTVTYNGTAYTVNY